MIVLPENKCIDSRIFSASFLLTPSNLKRESFGLGVSLITKNATSFISFSMPISIEENNPSFQRFLTASVISIPGILILLPGRIPAITFIA